MRDKITAVILMMKPKQLALLMITMYGAYFIAGGTLDALRLTLLTLVGIGSAGGVTALNMYLEYDIDSIMERTRSRPLPAKLLEPREALLAITSLILLGVLSGYLINKYVAFAALTGLYFDIVAYTELAKRRTEWALLFGSVAGSMPALGGWAAGRGCISIPGILLAGIVYVWQPLHVAFIHYYFEDDYERAGIPTIPGKLGYKAFAKLALSSILLSILLIWASIILLKRGYVTGILSSVLGAGALISVERFLRNPSREAARRMIKFASPLVGLFFLLLPIEILLYKII